MQARPAVQPRPGAREPWVRGSNDRQKIYLGVKHGILTPDFLGKIFSGTHPHVVIDATS